MSGCQTNISLKVKVACFAQLNYAEIRTVEEELQPISVQGGTAQDGHSFM